jgi:hypothetical protein
MRSLTIFAFLFLSVSAFAETSAMSIGEIDGVIKAEAPTPAVVQPMLPATVSEYFYMPAGGQTAAQLQYGKIDGTIVSQTMALDMFGNYGYEASEIAGTQFGLAVNRSIANNLYMAINVQNSEMNFKSSGLASGNVSYQRYGLGLTKILNVSNTGNLIFGARTAAYVTNTANTKTFDQYQVVPFVGYEQLSRGAAWGAEVSMEKFIIEGSEQLFLGTAFYEIPAATNFMVGTKAGLNAQGLNEKGPVQTGYQGGIYSKYTPVQNTDVRFAVDTANKLSSSTEKTTEFSIGFRRTL